MINPAAIEAAQRTELEQRDYFHSRATILRPDRQSDARGSVGKSYKPVPGIVPCQVVTDTDGGETVAGEQVKTVNSWELRFPVGTTITPVDHIQVDGSVYAVNADDRGRTNAQYLSVFCVRAK